MAPNLVHVCRFIWEWTYAKYSSPITITGSILGILGVTNSSLLKLSNGWTDWHQIWQTCADSYGNGYTPNKLSFETQGGTWGGGLGGQTFNTIHNTPRGILVVFRGLQIQMSGELSNGSTDWHQIWYMSADSYGNGHS